MDVHTLNEYATLRAASEYHLPLIAQLTDNLCRVAVKSALFLLLPNALHWVSTSCITQIGNGDYKSLNRVLGTDP